MKLIRTFHPVGHGAFYTERFYDENVNNIANVVYDCGSKTISHQDLDALDCLDLTSVTISNSVTSIDHSVFYKCSSLKTSYYA